MSKFEWVLSDAELISATFKVEAEGTMGELRAVEQAVLAKLAEQGPVAWRITAKRFFGDFTKDKATAQWWQDAEPESVTPLYAHPMPCVSQMSNKIACVSESGESETQESEPFTPKTVSEMRSFIGMRFDSLQYANPETEEPDEMDRYTLTIHDLLSAFDWAGHYDCDYIAGASKIVGLDHIPDDGKMITGNQYGSIGESQAKIISAVQNYADKRVMAVYGNAGEIEVHEAYWNLAERIQAELEALQENSNHIADKCKKVPEGWQLVPIEITAGMLRDAHIRSELGAYAVSNLSEGYSLIRNLYDVLMASAPKYTGEK